MQIRTRFAPSPTGLMHIGGIRTAMYCYALANRAKKENPDGGSFILRIEDTDRSRFSAESLEYIFDSLEIYGLNPDESAKTNGEFGPYIQSERLDKYLEVAKQLVEKGAAYYCFLTAEQEEELRNIYKAQKRPFRSPHRDLSQDEVEKRLALGEKYVIRQKLPEDREVEYTDGLQGKMRFSTNDIDEGVLLKTADEEGKQFPTYHLAVIVDDHEMQISHVFRGVEWMPSTPKHVLLYEAMGWQMPQIFHLSLILDPEGGKLSKRKGATASIEFIKEGYLPEAVLNFLMMLGWSSPLPREYGQAERELYTLEEFVELFDTKDLNKASPVFNREKLVWYNQQYLAKMSNTDVKNALFNWINLNENELENIDLINLIKLDQNLEEKLALVKERVKLLSEIPNMLKFFYVKPSYIGANSALNHEKLKNIPRENLAQILNDLKALHQSLGEDAAHWTQEAWEMPMRALADQHALKHGDLFMLLRLAVVGEPVSPPMLESLKILGSQEVLERLEVAASNL